MARRTVNLQVNADGAQISEGLVARVLKWLGADITLTGSGTNVYTYPAATDTLVARTSTDTLTNKTLSDPIYTAVANVSGSNVTTTGQSLIDITGLSIALAANTVYDFQANLSIRSTSTAGVDLGVQFSTAGASVEAQIVGTNAATTAITNRLAALNTKAAQSYDNIASGDGVALITGRITVGANAGNFTVQFAKDTSGTATIYINSTLRVWRVS